MRRRYAFEAEGVSDEVKAQLEKVEDVVDEKCDTADACNKMLDKIEDETEKFNGALKDMAGAAKDCKDGKCDKAEMAAQISPKMAELKEVAKSIGVASEGETLTEAELKDAKDYLEGAKEIVESKLDEVGGDDKGGKDDDEDEEPDDDDDEEAEECVEAYMEELDVAIESFYLNAAMEGANVDSVVTTVKRNIQLFKGPRSEMKKAVKAGDYKTAAEKAKECASVADDLIRDLNGLNDSVASTIIVDLALMIAALLVGTSISGIKAGSVARKAAKAARTGAVAAAHAAKQTYDETAASGYDMMGSGGAEKAAYISDAAKGAFDAGQKKAAAARGAIKGKMIRGGGIGAAAGAAVVAAPTAVASIKFLRSRKAVDEEGNVTTKKLAANDLNPLIMAMKADARMLKNHYSKLASQYEKKAASGEGAAESYLDYDGFISACESIAADSNYSSRRRSRAPYLFG